MKAEIIKAKALTEYLTPERCYLYENLGSEKVSIARARVKPGVTTAAHHLEDADEIYIITKGKGRAYIGSLEPTEVAAGDVVAIPAGTSQRIANIGKTDLVFYCVCTPRFTAERYFNEEAASKTK
jgi:mannose-6-phosphate isomerase-like protein (cupin superfamily)